MATNVGGHTVLTLTRINVRSKLRNRYRVRTYCPSHLVRTYPKLAGGFNSFSTRPCPILAPLLLQPLLCLCFRPLSSAAPNYICMHSVPLRVLHFFFVTFLSCWYSTYPSNDYRLNNLILYFRRCKFVTLWLARFICTWIDMRGWGILFISHSFSIHFPILFM